MLNIFRQSLVFSRQHALCMLAVCMLAMCFTSETVLSKTVTMSQPQVRLPLFKTVPVIDGRINEAEWSGAARMAHLFNIPRDSRVLDAQGASFWVGSDGVSLYIAMISDLPPGRGITAKVPPSPQEGDARTWLDDSIELVLDPLRTDTTGRRRMYHANINSRNAINDTAYIPQGGAEAWRGGWHVASHVIENQWHFELAIPLADMGVTAKDMDKPFGVRIARNWKHAQATPGQSEWAAMGGAFLNPDTMPLVTWDSNAPVVQMHQIKSSDARSVHLRTSISNPTDKLMAVQAAMHVAPANSAPKGIEQVVEIAPGKTQWIELEASPASMTEKMSTAIVVRATEGDVIYYSRDFTWQLAHALPTWTADEGDVRKIDLNFAYYPSDGQADARVNYAAIKGHGRVTGVKLSVVNKADHTVISSVTLPAGDGGVVSHRWTLPKLAEGAYACVVQLQGVEIEPATLDFVRHVFPWEGNTLGLTDHVPAGFEPLDAGKDWVDAVLRHHELDGLGLWKQVTSDGQPMLASPMRLEVTVDGKTHVASGDQLEVTRVNPTHAQTKAQWTAASVSGSSQSRWDIDGSMFWTLSIKPGQKKIERMTLVIPLVDEHSPFMQVCTDGIRFNYSGVTPSGQGVIWDGSKAPRNSIIGSYVPYIYVGAEARGLAVFGENDRGWETDSSLASQQLVRHGPQLELHLNLIAKPVTLTEERTITIGFVATPTKRMPKNWRRWITDSRYKTPDVATHIGFMGSCWYWGALTPCLDVYPRNEDFSLWNEYAKTRKTGQDNPAFMKHWVENYPDTSDEKQMAIYRGHISGGFHLLKQQPDRVVVYTNARGVRFDTREGQTFVDEWHRDAFTTRSWPLGGGVAYDLNPGQSFRDYAMYYYNKMLDTFVDDIYWDDIFMQSNFNLAGSDAYRRSDGLIQPASGLNDMRELMRRTLMLGEEKGRPMLNWAHMTNTPIAPILSFSQIAFTWEDHAGDRPFQERYSREYIRAESLGLQTGNAPFALILVHGNDQVKNDWAKRTAAGVMLTHEIKTHTPIPAFQKALARLWAFGYGQISTQVFNYWQPDYPLNIQGGETSSIVVAKADEVMIVICDWKQGAELVVTPDSSLGMGPDFKAVNVETGKPVQVNAQGRITIKLDTNDFVMLRLTSNAKAAE